MKCAIGMPWIPVQTAACDTLFLYMQTGFHHTARSHLQGNKRSKKLILFIDKSAYIMGSITVAVNVPQLISVWTSPDIAGVSLISWTGFLLGSCFWLTYGILHKEKTITIVNAMLIVVQGLIVAGVILR